MLKIEYFEGLLFFREAGCVRMSSLSSEEVDWEIRRNVSELFIMEKHWSLNNAKLSKGPRVGTVTDEMLGEGSDVVYMCYHAVCMRTWNEGMVPEDWINVIIIQEPAKRCLG